MEAAADTPVEPLDTICPLEHEQPLRSMLRSSKTILLWTLSLPVLTLGLSIFVERNFLLESPGIGLIQDGSHSFIFLQFLLLLFLMSHAASRFEMFLERIPEFTKGAESAEWEAGLREVRKRLEAIFSARGRWGGYRIGAILLGSGYALFNAYNRAFHVGRVWHVDDFWVSAAYPWTYWLLSLYLLLVWGYMLPAILIRIVGMIAAIGSVCRTFTRRGLFDLKPLSPDKAGGLRSLGDLSLAMCYLTLPLTAHVLAYYFSLGRLTVPLIGGLLGLMGITLLVFLLPVSFANRAMVNSKREVLGSICSAFSTENRKFLALVEGAGEARDSRAETEIFERIKRLDEAYEMASRMPVWPFDFTVLGRVLAASVIPLGLLLAERVLGGR